MRKLVSLASIIALLSVPSMTIANTQKNYEKFYERHAPSSVFIKMKFKVSFINPITEEMESRVAWGSCSGTFISQDGNILTASHCIETQEGVELVDLWIKELSGKTHQAKIVKYNSQQDLAILDIDGTGYAAAKVAKKMPKPGNSVLTIAHPVGLEWTFSQGYVSRLKHLFPDSRTRFIQHTVMINPGSSGSALLNERGEIVGVNTRIMGIMLWNGLGFAVDLNEVKAFLGDGVYVE